MSGLEMRDWTELSPVQYRVRPRLRSEIRAEVLHQTGFEWRVGNPMWARVRAHFVVHRSGLVTQLHAITDRMRYGCGPFNAHAINVEHEGNYPLDYVDGVPVYWRPEKYGRSVLADAPAQVEAGRQLLAWLAEQVPGMMVGCHRQVEIEKSGCCGPDLWREIGQYGVDVLDLPELPRAGGRDIPDAWRGAVAGRDYVGPLSV